MTRNWLGMAMIAALGAAGSAAAATPQQECAACAAPTALQHQLEDIQSSAHWGRWQAVGRTWEKLAAAWEAQTHDEPDPQLITRAFTDLSYGQSKNTAPGKAAAPRIDPRLLASAQPYMKSVRRWAREFELPESLLLAVIHTESRFDPKARSHANAIGLMQLVAKRAGADAWHYITGKRRVPSEAELLDPDTNIRLGAAYLRMLKDRYWSHIEDPLMRRALVLASYNWGIGNVRRRLKISPALAPEALHRAIDRAAPAETSGYLRSVQQRARDYEQFLVAGAEQLAAQ